MKVAGLDLAGCVKNPTGYCLLTADEKTRNVAVELLHTDKEIRKKIAVDQPEVVAIDAPLIYSGENRSCDEQLIEYGALPVTLKGMEMLAQRGSNLAEELRTQNIQFIEVNVKASSKILGVSAKDDHILQKKLLSLSLSGDVNHKYLSRDELDAITAALTGYLYLIEQTKTVGDEKGQIHIPDI